MAPLFLEENHEETYEETVEGIRVCIECGSPDTTILTKGIYCRDCRSFKLFRRRKSAKNGELGELQ